MTKHGTHSHSRNGLLMTTKTHTKSMKSKQVIYYMGVCSLYFILCRKHRLLHISWSVVRFNDIELNGLNTLTAIPTREQTIDDERQQQWRRWKKRTYNAKFNRIPSEKREKSGNATTMEEFLLCASARWMNRKTKEANVKKHKKTQRHGESQLKICRRYEDIRFEYVRSNFL